MDKPQKSQIAKISLIALLFFITPLLSSSMRRPYLFFLLNLLIIALGAEAGLLSFLTPSDHQEKNKKFAFVAPKPVNVVVPPVKEVHDPTNSTDHDAVITKNNNVESSSQQGSTDQKKVVMKSISEKIITVTAVKVHKCSSMPSLFFIGGCEGDAEENSEAEDDWVEEEEEMEGTLSGQELFTKAESFIGNFYKQLKMQREESWNRIHGLYHKAF